DCVIQCTWRVLQESLAAANRKIPHFSEKEHVLSIKTGWTTAKRAIVDEIIILVISSHGECVVSKNVQTRKPVLKLGLQRVIAIISVVAEIINTLSPAETVEERLAVILRTWSCYR